MKKFRDQLFNIVAKDGLEKYVCSLIPSETKIDHSKIQRFFAIWQEDDEDMRLLRSKIMHKRRDLLLKLAETENHDRKLPTGKDTAQWLSKNYIEVVYDLR
jgi:hypothetical protein